MRKPIEVLLPPLICSFCGRSEREVAIVGNPGAFICQICVEVAMTAICEKTGGKIGPQAMLDQPSPPVTGKE